VVAAVEHTGLAVSPVQQPGETARHRVVVVAKEVEGMCQCSRCDLPAETGADCHGGGDHVAGAAHQMAGMGVVNAAVVAQEMEHAAGRIDGARKVEAQRVTHVGTQERRTEEIG
jgi:hypothetical protein